MSYPDYKTYEKLYKRYLRKDPGDLLCASSFRDNLEGIAVLDLCGGNGRFSIMAAKRGAKVTLIDQERKMVPENLTEDFGIEVIIDDVSTGLDTFLKQRRRFDLVVCHQAITYWLDAVTARKLSYVMHLGSVFVFNTFNQEPSPGVTIKEYEINFYKFREVISYEPSTRTVSHVQTLLNGDDGPLSHSTVFRFIPMEDFFDILYTSPFYQVTQTMFGKTTIWTCKH